MSASPKDMGELWAGLEPEQPRSSRIAFWVALLATLLLLLGAVALGAFLLSQDSGDAQSTAIGESDADNAAGLVLATAQPFSTDLPITTTEAPELASTATLPGLPVSDAQVTAVRLPGQISVDANLEEWAGVPSVTSPFIVYSSSAWDGSDDLEVNWQLAWDTENLYVAVVVSDNIHAQDQTGNSIFRGDSLDLQIDTDRNGDYGSSLSPDDFQITLSPGDFAGLPPSAFRFQGTTNGDMLDAMGPHSIRVAARPQADGYMLEAAIPWRDLNMAPIAGIELGLALNATDNDQPGTATQEIMKSNAANRTFGDPATWGTLILQ